MWRRGSPTRHISLFTLKDNTCCYPLFFYPCREKSFSLPIIWFSLFEFFIKSIDFISIIAYNSIVQRNKFSLIGVLKYVGLLKIEKTGRIRKVWVGLFFLFYKFLNLFICATDKSPTELYFEKSVLKGSFNIFFLVIYRWQKDREHL